MDIMRTHSNYFNNANNALPIENDRWLYPASDWNGGNRNRINLNFMDVDAGNSPRVIARVSFPIFRLSDCKQLMVNGSA